jgi:hypothetical protein
VRGRLQLLHVAALGSLVLVLLVGGQAQGARVKATHASEDRSLKLDLIARLATTPETIVLGSSRGRRAEPAYLERLTGHTAFNGAVRGGTAADAWVTARYLVDCAPRRSVRRYLWFVDAGLATNGIPPELSADPRSRAYLGLPGGLSRPALCKPLAPPDGSHEPDGSYTPEVARSLPEHAKNLDAEVAKLVASVEKHHGALNLSTDPKRYAWFEKALALMNRQGATPVIVFNPIQPKVLGALRKYGFPVHRAALRYLQSLHKRFDFVVVDAENIYRWGGSAVDFWDPTHVNYANMRRLLTYVSKHSDDAL